MGLAIRTSNEPAHEVGGLWQRFNGEGLAAGIPGRIGGADITRAFAVDYESHDPATPSRVEIFVSTSD